MILGLGSTDEPFTWGKSLGRGGQKRSRKFSDFSRSSDCSLGVVSSDLTVELRKFAETQISECFMHKNQ